VGDRTDSSIGLERAAQGNAGSALRVYRDLVVGPEQGLGALLRHELVVAWGASTPGALGFALRRWLWRGSLFERCGSKVVWARNITLWHAAKMRIGDRVAVDEGSQLDARGCSPGEFLLGDGVLIGRGCVISGKDGPLAIGPRSNIGAGCIMYASTRLVIGSDVLLAAQCYVGGGRYTTRGRTDIPIADQPVPRQGVVIDDDCWLGAGVKVVDGVHIGRGSIVAAGAVVTTDVEPYSIVGGVPARRLGSRLAEAQLEEHL
jgi:acetyltransferase-like isoleucine patch superfamily enzyme